MSGRRTAMLEAVSVNINEWWNARKKAVDTTD